MHAQRYRKTRHTCCYIKYLEMLVCECCPFIVFTFIRFQFFINGDLIGIIPVDIFSDDIDESRSKQPRYQILDK